MTEWCGGRGQVKWLTDVVVGASQMTDWHSNAVMQWYSGRGQVKWLTDVVAGASQMTDAVMRYCSDTVVEGKSNDWMMWWQWAKSNDWCSNAVLQWYGGRRQVKWLTDVVAGGKSKDWLMQWYSNTVCLALALSLALALVLALALALALEMQATWRNFRYLIFCTSPLLIRQYILKYEVSISQVKFIRTSQGHFKVKLWRDCWNVDWSCCGI